MRHTRTLRSEITRTIRAQVSTHARNLRWSATSLRSGHTSFSNRSRCVAGVLHGQSQYHACFRAHTSAKQLNAREFDSSLGHLRGDVRTLAPCELTCFTRLLARREFQRHPPSPRRCCWRWLRCMLRLRRTSSRRTSRAAGMNQSERHSCMMAVPLFGSVAVGFGSSTPMARATRRRFSI